MEVERERQGTGQRGWRCTPDTAQNGEPPEPASHPTDETKGQECQGHTTMSPDLRTAG